MKNKKALWISLSIIIILCALLAGIGLAFLFSGKDAGKYAEKIALGDKYLKELQYEDAVLAYTEAINLQPKQTGGYIRLSEVYYVQGDYKNAKKVMEDCVSITGATDENTLKQQDKISTALSENTGSEDADTGNTADGQDAGADFSEDTGNGAQNTVPDENSSKEAADQGLVKASVLQEYKGKTYTVYTQGASDWVYVGNDYLDLLLVYQDHIYYMDQQGTAGGVFSIVRMNLDKSDPVTISSNAHSSGFYAYDGYLYYTYAEAGADYETIREGSMATHKINLDTLEETAYSDTYTILEMDEKNTYAIVNYDYNKLYSFTGDFQNQTFVMNIYSYNSLNYMDENYIYVLNGESYLNEMTLTKIDRANPSSSSVIVSGAGIVLSAEGYIWYAALGSPLINQQNLETGEVTQLNMPQMGQTTRSRFVGVTKDYLYIKCFKQSDTTQDFYRLSLKDQTVEFLGNWFES